MEWHNHEQCNAVHLLVLQGKLQSCWCQWFHISSKQSCILCTSVSLKSSCIDTLHGTIQWIHYFYVIYKIIFTVSRADSDCITLLKMYFVLLMHHTKIAYYNHFIGHCGVFCRLKWRIQQAKIYLSPLPWTNQKQENNEASQLSRISGI